MIYGRAYETNWDDGNGHPAVTNDENNLYHVFMIFEAEPHLHNVTRPVTSQSDMTPM